MTRPGLTPATKLLAPQFLQILNHFRTLAYHLLIQEQTFIHAEILRVERISKVSIWKFLIPTVFLNSIKITYMKSKMNI